MNSGSQRGLTRLDTLRGMRLWNVSGALVAVHSAITAGAVSTGYALHLGASNALIGFLSAAPSWGQVLQMFSPLVIERLPARKPLCLAAYAVGYSLWLLIALIPFIVLGSIRPWAMIILVALSGATLALASPASTSWLTDLVPPEVRGRFIARQQTIVSAFALVASVIAGKYIDLFEGQTGFMSLFVIAVLFGIASVAVWALVPEPEKARSQQGSIFRFLSLPVRHSHFRNFTMFVAVRGLAVMVAAPFFTVYMLKNLRIPYTQIAIFSALASISSIAANPLWGYLADKFGNKPILRLSSFALALIPFMWVFATRHNYWIVIPLNQIWAGVMSSGVVLSQFNLMVKTAPEENRSVYIGWYSATVNIAFSIGAVLGGALADTFSHLGPLHFYGIPMSSLQCVFLVSTLLRLLGLSFLSRVREEKEVAASVVINQVSRGNPLATLWHLTRMLRSSDAATKVQATKALGTARTVLAVEELISALDDSDRDVRREAARALGAIGDERAVEPLIARLRDPFADIAEEATEALGKIPSPQSFASLVELLKDERPSVCKSAVFALGNMGDPRATRPLRELLTRTSDPAVLQAATEGLGRMGDKRALHRLRVLLRNSPSIVARKELANSLGNVLGRPGEFYRLLQAEPLRQEEMVATIFRGSRRRIGGGRAGSPESREYIEVHLDAGLQRFSRQHHAAALACLRHVALHVVRTFVSSDRGTALLSTWQETYDPDLKVEKKAGLLFRTSENLRVNFAFLYGIHREGRHRTLHPEETLLGVFAFKQLVDELVRLARGWKGTK